MVAGLECQEVKKLLGCMASYIVYYLAYFLSSI